MGITKQYLLYKPLNTFNVIASGRPNVSFVIYNKIEGRYAVVGAAENAIVWDLRLGQKLFNFEREKQEVTAIRASPDKIHVAIGYGDGEVQVFDLNTRACTFSLALHRSPVSVLRYDSTGIRLVSGGQDTEIVVADVVSEMGKHRLSGHNAPVTDVHFLENGVAENIVVSCSKDTQIKFWNLETQSCFKTLVDNRTEIWGLALVDQFLIAGTGENFLNVYKITDAADNTSGGEIVGQLEGLSLDDDNSISPIKVFKCGTIQRAARGRLVSIVATQNGRVVTCHGTNDLVENFYFCNESEARLRLKKRLKKVVNENTTSSSDVSLTDIVKRLPSIKNGAKIKSIDIVSGMNNELRVVVNCANNTLRLHSLDTKDKSVEPKILREITQCGHHSEVRSVSFSSDSLELASGSAESLKVWNRDSGQCIRTIETDYVVVTCFTPGDRHVLVGTKSGKLHIVDISIGVIVEHIEAHKGEIWAIDLLPEKKGCVTGSADKTVKFWSFELIENENENIPGSKVLSLLHKNTLKLEETVLCIKISPNGKFIAVGLLDSTVKIFFLDSFKFYLSLFGHNLPVLCMDISYDSSLIVTGSADRNVKIWGLDFGDCHKSLFAHDDSVMGIQFVPKTHLFFSCGKDGKIKQWDADSFNKIVNIPGHLGEAYTLTVSPNGKYVASCGSDRTIRLFERTEEPIVLQDAQEEEREEIENRTLATGEDNAVPTLPGLKLASRKTIGSEKAAESILECLEICRNFNEEETATLHPLMQVYGVNTPLDFFIAVVERIRSSELEESLVLLSFSDVCQILEMIPQLSDMRKDHVELICKISLFLFKIHQKPIISNHTLLTTITKLISRLKNSVTEYRDMVGTNSHMLQLLQRDIEARDDIELFRDATKARKQKEKKFKKRQLIKRLHVHTS